MQWSAINGGGFGPPGQTAGGANGGNGVTPGAGASDVRTSQNDLSTRLLVAGGGGGYGFAGVSDLIRNPMIGGTWGQVGLGGAGGGSDGQDATGSCLGGLGGGGRGGGSSTGGAGGTAGSTGCTSPGLVCFAATSGTGGFGSGTAPRATATERMISNADKS